MRFAIRDASRMEESEITNARSALPNVLDPERTCAIIHPAGDRHDARR